MKDVGIYLSWNNQQEGFRIPVNPDAIEIKESGEGKTYDVAGLGEINVIKSPKLTEISFGSIFPAMRYPFVVANALAAPIQYVQFIQRWLNTKRPIRFVFVSGSYDINLPMSIEKFSWKEVAGSPGDIEYDLSLKKYVFYAAKRVAVQPAATPEARALVVAETQRPVERQEQKSYAIASGDTLWLLAQRFLGDGSRWPEIQSLNNMTDADVLHLPIGREIRLPGGTANA
ncbi:LysM peptidoglycan-binding domain-containing protein [Heliophilum fasciatum]|uniref:Nucleoid-associated protein YgaU n=1 Tax=Heliophilum fasciatum TaxID=35700 RepID=A0A4V2SX40_9FIRM|nr:LysM peptidoglycan-binding domain-containing protein [Heliophilum fasciatum]MCW2277729.1 nucleoid-associated protein YgaU [Heliophilum fasciatum]TCP64776.1 nucleoid-associated protein YgaU [Heliophilum fasciatum]